MVAPPSIADALRTFEKDIRVLRMKSLARIADVAPFDDTCPPVHDDGMQMLVIHLQNAWATFCRELVRLSAEGHTSTLSGNPLQPVVLPAGHTSFRRYFRTKASEVALSIPNRQQPVWHDPEYIVLLAKALGTSNFNDIEVGVGGAPELGNINTVRNYVAHPEHRNTNYERYVRSISTKALSPAELLSHPTSSGGTVFEGWLSGLEAAATIAAA